jgi:replicative DNA helicase
MQTPRVEWKPWSRVVLDQAAKLEQRAIARIEGRLRPEDLFVPTGIRRWDANGGLTRGVLTVLGGVDGQGKSIVSNHLAQNAARIGLQVAQLVFEDPEEQTANRSIATQTGIDSRRLNMVSFDMEDMDKIMAAARSTADWGENISYHAGLVSVEALFEALHMLAEAQAARGKALDLVLLDYAQAFDGGDEGLEAVIRKMAWDANVFAQKWNCAFVVFSQVKPEVAQRGQGVFFAAKKRDPESWDVSGFIPGPNTSDLAWSSAFGQRGRAVGYIFRPGFYEKMMGKPGALDNRLWIRWAKVNFGSYGMLELNYDGAIGRLWDT